MVISSKLQATYGEIHLLLVLSLYLSGHQIRTMMLRKLISMNRHDKSVVGGMIKFQMDRPLRRTA